MSKKRSRVYVFEPVGWDVFDRRANTPDAGTRVVKTQPYGTPRNGTMGQCFVNDADSGEFYGLVSVNSLKATNEYVVPRDLAAEAREERSRKLREDRARPWIKKGVS
jgi:hypothetical protein